MVKGLKVLRHQRTEVGYFNEFLIAKTPDDVENRPILNNDMTAGGAAASASMAYHHPQAGVYSSMSDFMFENNSAIASSGPQWLYQLQQQQQQQPQPPQPSYRDPSEAIFLNPSVPSTTASVDIARQEVVVTSSTAENSMAAGMSKMKFNLGQKLPRKSPPRLSTARSSLAEPATTTIATPTPTAAKAKTATPAADDNWQRRATRRRERNRAAAARCRKKRQDQLDGLAAEVRELEAERSDLEHKVAGLSAARSELLRRLRDHQLTCPATDSIRHDALATESPIQASLTTVVSTVGNEPITESQQDAEILLTPSLLLPPSPPSAATEDDSDPFKLEPL